MAISLTLSSSFTCFAASTSYEVSEYTTINVEDLESNTLTEEQIAEQKNAATSAVKKAIAWGLRHTDDVVEAAAKYLDLGLLQKFCQSCTCIKCIIKI